MYYSDGFNFSKIYTNFPGILTWTPNGTIIKDFKVACAKE